MNKRIPFNLDGRKSKFLITVIEYLCLITEKAIKGKSEQENYHRYFNLVYLFVGEITNEMLGWCYMDINQYDLEDPIWMEMINKGMFYVETIRCRCEWIITPTLLQLTMHVPSMLYQLRKFNIENEYNLTMKDLDDNVMELLIMIDFITTYSSQIEIL